MVRSRLPKRSFRGQALVETALVLPLLALLLVMALDFGRVFFGWIALQNAARIGADFAATVPLAWDTPGEPQDRDRYLQLIQDDLDAINCELVDGIPPPTFQDSDGNGEANDDGDYAVVDLRCSFELITPLAQAILGGPVAMAAHEEFPINVRHVQGVPPPPPPPPGSPTPSPTPSASASTCVAPVAAFTWSPDPVRKNQPAAFTDTSSIGTCTAIAWSWDFDDGGVSSQQNPSHTYTWSGNGTKRFDVTLTITTSGGADSVTERVTGNP